MLISCSDGLEPAASIHSQFLIVISTVKSGHHVELCISLLLNCFNLVIISNIRGENVMPTVSVLGAVVKSVVKVLDFLTQ